MALQSVATTSVGPVGDDLVDIKQARSGQQAKESKQAIVDWGKGWQPSCNGPLDPPLLGATQEDRS
jgi:hypothetical protein